MQNVSIHKNVPLFFYVTYKKAFGDRWVTICSGLNLYASPRGYSRARRNTLEGPGSLALNMYSRSYFVDSQQPAALKLVNQLKDIAQSNMCLMDPVMVGACQGAQGLKDRRNICARNIVTCGSPDHGFGFSNSVHLDNRDLLGKRRSTRYMEEVDAYAASVELPRHCEEKRLYVWKWIRRFGCLSVPTTCAYEFIGDFYKEPTCAMCFFLFPAIGTAVRLETGTGLQFYGAVLQHMTSVTLAVNHRVVVYDNKSKASVFAWGGAGANSDEVTNVPRRRRRRRTGVVEEAATNPVGGGDDSDGADSGVSDLFAAAAGAMDDVAMEGSTVQLDEYGLDLSGVFSTEEDDEMT